MKNKTDNPLPNSAVHKKVKVLVVDDDRSILRVITLILEDAGYEVQMSQGRLGSIVQEFKPDLILLDIWLAGIDGKVICKELKSKRATKEIPIILFSANKDAGRIAEESGANDFITKPFEMKDLLAIVKKYAD